MRWLLVPFLCVAAPVWATGKSGDQCRMRCSERMNDCTKSCKNGPCISRCGSQMEKCSMTCGEPSADTKGYKEPKAPPGGLRPPPKD